MIGYKVGGEFFYNKYLALYNCWKNNQPVEFLCNDHEYDKLDWSREPDQSFEDLMTAHAVYLRNKFERLILGWSGGSDSHTIYNIFKKNNIHIDEIIIKTSEDLDYQPKHHALWMRKNHYDASTIITEYDQYDDFYRLIDRPNEEWIWSNSGDICHAGVNTGGAHTKFQLEKNHGGKNYIFITGYEKPQLRYLDKKWWCSIADRTIYHVIGHNYNIEYFYLQPLIHLKQCFLLKNFVKKYALENKKILNDNTLHWPIIDYDYNNAIKALGRTELTHGVSKLQKAAFINQMSIDFSQQTTYKFLTNHKEDILKGTLSSGNKASLNYFKGLFNLYHEKKFVAFLNEKYVKSAQHKLLNLHNIHSKWYNLGA